jgi:4-amino-4-deoxy-L-arabinose transferase-like glycosyltransferase
MLLEERAQSLLLWGGWLTSLVVLYSVAAYFHPYNLVMLAPPLCAAAALGLEPLWHLYRVRQAGWWLLPLALACTGVVQAIILLESAEWQRWLVGVVLVAGLGAPVWLVLRHGRTRRREQAMTAAAGVTAAAMIALLLAPALWASVPVWHYGNAEFPLAGPDLLDPAVQSAAATRDFLAPRSLVSYLENEQHGERYLLAVRYGGVAAPVMLASRRAVLTYGGYLGEDHILEVPQIAALVRARQVRFFWTPAAQADRASPTDIEGWVAAHCAVVPPGRWQPGRGGSAAVRLYDCGRAEASR